jgi:hypothetical protein
VFFWGVGGGSAAPRPFLRVNEHKNTVILAAHGRVPRLKPISNKIFVFLANKNWKCCSVIGTIQQSILMQYASIKSLLGWTSYCTIQKPGGINFFLFI